jgi:K+-sensing histidine kinase KdpD
MSMPIMIKTDKIIYQRILLNLIAYAMKHTKNRGITVGLTIEKTKFITDIRVEGDGISS